MRRYSIFLLAACVVVALWFLSILIMVYLFGVPQDLATAGDMFGGISSLFSGLALAGVVLALWLQTTDVQTNQRNLEKTMEANRLSLEMIALSALLQECDAALARYERWEKSGTGGDYTSSKRTVRAKLKRLRHQLEGRLEEVQDWQPNMSTGKRVSQAALETDYPGEPG